MISTDLHQLSINGPAYDLPTTLSKFLHLGMSLPEVIRAATARPAEILGLDQEVGTLRPGSRRRHRALSTPRRQLPALRHLGRDARGAPAAREHAHDRGRPGAADSSRPTRRAPWAEHPIWPPAQIPFTERQQVLRDRGHTPAEMRAPFEG